MRLLQKEFRAWLKAKQPGESVGASRSCHACPLALFYEHASGGAEVVIADYGNGYRIDRGDGARRLPTWANNFVHNIDGNGEIPVTAAHALQILEAGI